MAHMTGAMLRVMWAETSQVGAGRRLERHFLTHSLMTWSFKRSKSHVVVPVGLVVAGKR